MKEKVREVAGSRWWLGGNYCRRSDARFKRSGWPATINQQLSIAERDSLNVKWIVIIRSNAKD